MSQPLCLDSIPDDELLKRLSTLVDRHRRCEADVVAHIAEVDARKLYLGKACSSMFAYAVEVLHLSEHEAYLRIACARASRRFPVLLDMLGDGRLHLSAVAKLAPHLEADNAETLLARAVHGTTRQIEELCAEVAPRPDVPSRMRKLPRVRPRRQPGDELGTNLVPGATAEGAARSTTAARSATAGSAANAAVVTTSEPTAATHAGPERAGTPTREAVPEVIAPARPVIAPIAPARYSVQFTASAELRDKLCRAKALLRHKDPDADLGDVIDEAVTLLLGKLEARRFGKTKTPRKALADTDTSASSRYVPAAVRRVVFDRDQGRCAYVDEASGRRCACTDPGLLEYHHVTPFALGCDHDPDQIELRCRAHNQYQAELDFGPETMARYRTGTSRAREPQAAYGPGPGTPGIPRIDQAGGKPPRAAPREVASGGVAEARALKSSPATEPLVEAPGVADPRRASGALPICTGQPTRSTPVGGGIAGGATRSFWPGAPLLVARPGDGCGSARRARRVAGPRQVRRKIDHLRTKRSPLHLASVRLFPSHRPACYGRRIDHGRRSRPGL